MRVAYLILWIDPITLAVVGAHFYSEPHPTTGRGRTMGACMGIYHAPTYEGAIQGGLDDLRRRALLEPGFAKILGLLKSNPR